MSEPPIRGMSLGACGGIVMLIACAYALLSTVMGTCTQGSADDLEIGALACALGYILGVGLLLARPPSRFEWLLLSPVMIAIAYQAFFGASFFIAYHLHGSSACAWKEGVREYPPDGRESFLTAIWVGVPLLGLLGMAAAGFRGSRLRSRKAVPEDRT
jgi:hypothetical protein